MLLDRARLLDLERTVRLTIASPDGCGGWSAVTPLLCPSSRAHGLLVARPRRTSVPHVFLQRVAETVFAENRSFPLSIVRHQDGWHPGGHVYVESFASSPFPTTTYRLGRTAIQRTIATVRGRSRVACRYTLEGRPDGVRLSLRPFLSCRRVLATTHENAALDPEVEVVAGGIRCRPYQGLPFVSIAVDGRDVEFIRDPQWCLGQTSGLDRDEGLAGVEDAFSPGSFAVALDETSPVHLAAGLGRRRPPPRRTFLAATSVRAPLAIAVAPDRATPLARVRSALDAAAEALLVDLGDGAFGVLGRLPGERTHARTTAIALPGLLGGRAPQTLGRSLLALAGHLTDGRLPIFLPASGRWGRSADGALWFVAAVARFAALRDAPETLLRELLPHVVDVATAHEAANGTDLLCTTDGLLRASATAELAVGTAMPLDVPVEIARPGATIELNALWHGALRTAARLLANTGDSPAGQHFARLAARVGRALRHAYWDEERQGLLDRLDDDRTQLPRRPFGLVAIALPGTPFTRAERAAILAAAERDLLVPPGLRSLSPRDARYCGTIEGDPAARRQSMERGAAQPWLLGAYVDAVLATHGHARPTKRRLAAVLAGLEPHLSVAGVGYLSEAFDGNPPHRPRGAFVSAAAVAECRRALMHLDAVAT